MPTQKTFKRRVRARMTKTGESYTAARHQLLRKASQLEVAEPDTPEPETARPGAGAAEPGTAEPGATEPGVAKLTTAEPEASGASAAGQFDLPTSDAAIRRASGRGYEEWFALLDAWGATDRRHPEIARWLVSEHGVGGWWSHSITVAYERARGMRAVHQMPGGFSIGVTRTIAAAPAPVLAAFTDDAARRRWLPGVEIRPRRTTAAGTARFDWPDPPSRLVVTVLPKDAGRTTVAIGHEKLPDADAAAREKAAWRDRLASLRTLLERDQ